MPRSFTRSADDLLREYTIEGQIATLSPAGEGDLQEMVSIEIDGEPLTIGRAVIARDANRQPILDADGNPVIRYTTIYEAVLEHLDAKIRAEDPDKYNEDPLALMERFHDENPIPIVCHQEHLKPVAVCRMCVVEVCDKNGKADRTLAPACHRILDRGMKVKTQRTSPKVRSAIRLLAELLLSDQPEPKSRENPPRFHQLAANLVATTPPRLPPRSIDKGKDATSLMIHVDHNACILCDACIRSCTDVKGNNIIGRNGMGYGARIAFDLDQPMGDSECVRCGECAVSCPTDALTFVTFPQQSWEPLPSDQGETFQVQWQDLARHPLFAGGSRKFLEWNAKAMVRRRYRKGAIVCREGDFGSTAFLIERGSFGVSLQSTMGHIEKTKQSRSRWFWRYRSGLVSAPGEDPDRSEFDLSFASTDSGAGIDLPISTKAIPPLTRDDVLFGEMTCMSHYPRSATVTALEDGCEVIEILRNILYSLQRNQASRTLLDGIYTQRAIDTHLRTVHLFAPLQRDPGRFKEFVDWLRPRVNLVRVNPEQTIFRQGAFADDFYMIRSGFVRVSQQDTAGGSIVRNYLGPGGYFGELAVLTADPSFPFLDEKLLPPDLEPGRRTATCSAVDHVELVRVSGDDFRELVDAYPEISEQIRDEIVRRLEMNDRAAWDPRGERLANFLDQGLQGAQFLLVLDLESCTRCDECTRACSDSHEGVTRLIREGLRYDNYLVASSCRSCLDPYCLVGCPVGAIGRKQSLEILITDSCIGCGLCASNCPYGNINMHTMEVGTGAKDRRAVRKATTCDACQKVVPNREDLTNCVYACPHNAAFRMSGREFLERIRAESGS